MACNTNELTFMAVESGIPFGILETITNAAKKAVGKRLVISLREHKDKRSGKQNRYYFGVIIPAIMQMFNNAGNNVDAEEVHEFLKMHIGKLTTVIETPDGMRRTVTRSSTELNTADAEEYFEKIRAWAAQFDCQIPLPREGV